MRFDALAMFLVTAALCGWLMGLCRGDEDVHLFGMVFGVIGVGCVLAAAAVAAGWGAA